MGRPRSSGTPEHWARAQELFAAGLVYKSIEMRLDREMGSINGVAPPRHHTIRRRATQEGWLRSEHVGLHVGPAVEESEQTKERLAKFKAQGEINREHRLQQLTDELIASVHTLVGQMFEPHVLKEVKVVPGPQGTGSDVEVVEVELDQPTPRDKQALASAAAQLIDRVQLLTGKATGRTEVGPIMDRATAESRLKGIRDELSERRDAKATG